jgi:hypothetical protein
MKKKLVSLAFFALFIAGCVNQKKATRYMREHKNVAASVCAEMFPVKEVERKEMPYDSAAYYRSLDSLKSHSDSAWNELLQAFIDDCNKSKAETPAPYKPSYNLDTLVAKAKAEGAQSVKNFFASLPPKEVQVLLRDRAFEETLLAEIEKRKGSELRLTANYEQAKKERDAYRKLASQRLWWLIAIAAGFGIYVFRKPILRMFGLNFI